MKVYLVVEDYGYSEISVRGATTDETVAGIWKNLLGIYGEIWEYDTDDGIPEHAVVYAASAELRPDSGSEPDIHTSREVLWGSDARTDAPEGVKLDCWDTYFPEGGHPVPRWKLHWNAHNGGQTGAPNGWSIHAKSTDPDAAEAAVRQKWAELKADPPPFKPWTPPEPWTMDRIKELRDGFREIEP